MNMLRYNAGKAPLSLIPTSFFEAIFNLAFESGNSMPTKLIWQVGQVLDFGAQKYSAHNWRQGGLWSSVLNSALRHVISLIEGNTIDKESGLAETGHLGCNIAFLLEFATTGVGTDDRFMLLNLDQLPELEHEPAPGLIWVLNSLLSFKDGGSIDDLRDAAYQLARYVEAKLEPDPQPVLTVEVSQGEKVGLYATPDDDWRRSAEIDLKNGSSVETVAKRYGRAIATIEKLVAHLGIKGVVRRRLVGDLANEIEQLRRMPFSFPSFGHIKTDRPIVKH